MLLLKGEPPKYSRMLCPASVSLSWFMSSLASLGGVACGRVTGTAPRRCLLHNYTSPQRRLNEHNDNSINWMSHIIIDLSNWWLHAAPERPINYHSNFPRRINESVRFINLNCFCFFGCVVFFFTPRSGRRVVCQLGREGTRNEGTGQPKNTL